MALRNRSVATIDAPEFINLQEDAINPGISKCDIKVFYLGKNRNGSYIDKNMAIQMANSLPGTPIVAAYRKDIEDFGDHGEVIHIENGEIEFSCNTVPYGFVAPDAEVWFQKFDDTDEFGNTVQREYVMTTGYLWTTQYPEITKAIQEGQPQSMEIDDVDGHWATDNNDGMDFFIINDAVFTKLCILGDDVEPCFEGAAVVAPGQTSNFAKRNFTSSLFSMMNELKQALDNEGGSNMPNEDVTAQEETVEEVVEETAADDVEDFAVDEAPAETEPAEPAAEDGDGAAEDFAKEDEKEEDDSSDGDDSSDDVNDDKSDDDEEEEEPTKKNSLEEVQTQLSELQEQFSALNQEVEELRAFKAERIKGDKQALIDKYYMLDDEDKAEIVAHMGEYSLSDIEAKLALIYVQKNVDFEVIDSKDDADAHVDSSPITTFSLDDNSTQEAGEDLFLNALRETEIF